MAFFLIVFCFSLFFMGKDVGFIMRVLSRHCKGQAAVLFDDPFKVLIATMLSQRTKDANTGRAVERLFSRYASPQELACAKLSDLEKLIEGVGFFRVKAKRIQEISRIIVEKHGGVVPCSRASLQALPGVGAKTSACTLVYGFGVPEICVDTHVHRVSNRLGLVDTLSPIESEARLKDVVPKRYWLRLNHLMVRFGQRVCLPRNPRHDACPLRAKCDFFNRRGKWAELTIGSKKS